MFFSNLFLRRENMVVKTMAGIEFQIDEQDLKILEEFPKTFLDTKGYISTRSNTDRKLYRLHNLILPCKKGEKIDHKNQNKLDNRRENLRICTQAQNNRNVRKINLTSVSKFKGVRPSKTKNKWSARIRVEGKQLHLGTFSSETEAAEKYDDAAHYYHREFASLNFPKRTPNLFNA